METLKLRPAFGAFPAFVISGFYSVNKLRYLVWGRKARADVVEAYVGRDPDRRGRAEALIVKVAYPDEEGRPKSATDILDRDSRVAAGDKVSVQYVPGDDYTVRLEGNRKPTPVVIFLGCLGGTAVFLGMLIREANEPVAKKRRPAPKAGAGRRG